MRSLIDSCTIGQRRNTLYLLDGDGTFNIVTRTYTVRAEIIERLRIEGPEEFLATTTPMTFVYEGTFAEVTESGKLRIHNVPEELDLFETQGASPDPSFLDLLKQRWSVLWNR